PDLADWLRGSRIFASQVTDRNRGRRLQSAAKPCSEDQGHFPGGGRLYNAQPSCFSGTPSARRTARSTVIGASWRIAGSAATGRCRGRCCTGRDQRVAGTGLAQVNRHPGGSGTAAAHAVAVSGGPLRGIAAGRRDCSVAAKRTAVVPAAPVGRMLVGAELVARAGARWFLGRTAAAEPQGHAVG